MLQGISYVPLLHLRMAEMRALRELPSVSKAPILPIIRMRPWLTAKSLDRAFEVAEESVGSNRFGFDLDPTKFDLDDERPSYRDFCALFDDDAGYSNFYDKVQDSENLIPVMRHRADGRFLSIATQIERIEQIDRGAFVRIETTHPANFLEVASAINEAELKNIVFVFDCGWRVDVLGQAGVCTGLVNSLLNLTEEFEIVVAGSSFPDSFARLGGRFSRPISERVLFQEVRRQVNRGNLFYGDWGSTRKPSDPIPMTNIPRIDMAGTNHWNCWRSEDGESYQEVAQRVVADPLWDGDPDLWGEYLIQATAEGVEPSIKSPTTAAAVRINLHLNVQANFDNPDALDLDDEPVGDDL